MYTWPNGSIYRGPFEHNRLTLSPTRAIIDHCLSTLELLDKENTLMLMVEFGLVHFLVKRQITFVSNYHNKAC